ncbi:Uncharacterised protein [Chlamydia trachomatis]|nr:Uncharacterised protein [Chlamydia trachomatis]
MNPGAGTVVTITPSLGQFFGSFGCGAERDAEEVATKLVQNRGLGETFPRGNV